VALTSSSERPKFYLKSSQIRFFWSWWDSRGISDVWQNGTEGKNL